MRRLALPTATARTRRGVVALAFAALLVLAGCNAPTAPTVSLEEAERPPGVRDDHVDPEPLIVAHTSALADESYTVRFAYEGPNRTIAGVLRIGAGHERALLTLDRRVDGRLHATAVFVGPARVYVRDREGDGSPEYRVEPRRNWTVRHLRNDFGMLAPTLVALRQLPLEPVAAEGADGRTLVVLAGNGTALPPFHQQQPVHARLAVSERGVVHRVVFRGRAPNATSTWTLTQLGDTRVQRPAWVDDVQENRSR